MRSQQVQDPFLMQNNRPADRPESGERKGRSQGRNSEGLAWCSRVHGSDADGDGGGAGRGWKSKLSAGCAA